AGQLQLKAARGRLQPGKLFERQRRDGAVVAGEDERLVLEPERALPARPEAFGPSEQLPAPPYRPRGQRLRHADPCGWRRSFRQRIEAQEAVEKLACVHSSLDAAR